jgi:hypothetical protein
MDALEQDCLIASESGFAQAMGAEVTIQGALACPICQHKPGWLELIYDQSYVVCYKCGAIYEIDSPASCAVAAPVSERAEWLEDQRDTLADTQR